jgi:Abnormal spindle-like microcephaly-assoc'd, ASPM-SPD-2-Hydin
MIYTGKNNKRDLIMSIICRKYPGLVAALFVVFQITSIHQCIAGRTETGTLANGSGIMISGELWDSFMPANRGPFYSENTRDMLFTLVRIGNFDRAWSTPTHMWPGGWDRGAFWGKQIIATVWDPDPTFNPLTINGSPNPSYAGDPNYGFLAYPNPSRSRTVPGKGDPSRDYVQETGWVDPQTRHHALYQAGWPTTVGIDVNLAVHQFTLHWNNFDDFVIVVVTLTNTGVVDMNGDGSPELTGHDIEGLTLMAHGEYMSSYILSESGGRGNRFGATRGVGYVGDADPAGAPWAMHVSFPGESAPNLKDMGLFDFTSHWYTETTSAWAWLGARDTAGNDFLTVFGTHPVGTGSQRGWFLSDGTGKNLAVISPPTIAKNFFVASMGTFFNNGGKSFDSTQYDLSANSAFFSPGSVPGDIRTFAPLASPQQPDGDRKASNLFDVNTHEPGWTKGFTSANNFDGDGFQGIGPFKLRVGESITVTWAEAGGYRLRGVEDAIAAARWAYEHGLAVPEPPPAPDLEVHMPAAVPYRIFWDNRAENSPHFAGYRIYRASAATPVNWLTGGMRTIGNYWRTPTPGPTPDSLKDPVNPEFSGQSNDGAAGAWGPYELIAAIPSAAVSSFADATLPGYMYSYDDSTAKLGFDTWYYVAAVSNESVDLGNDYAGSHPPASTAIESSNVNRNGASGLWESTYPFARLNSAFPTTAEGRKNIGAAVHHAGLFASSVISFDTVLIGNMADSALVVTNGAEESLHVAITGVQGIFTSPDTSFVLASGETGSYHAVFSPVADGEVSSLVTFVREGIRDTLTLRGVGSTPASVHGQSSPARYVLYPCYPNPFNPSTTISFEVPKISVVSLVVYDIAGREVRRVAGGEFSPGRYDRVFDAQGMASGVYFGRITMTSDDGTVFTRITKLALVR